MNYVKVLLRSPLVRLHFYNAKIESGVQYSKFFDIYFFIIHKM